MARQFKRLYVFVHPLFSYLAQPTKTGKNRKGRQEFKAALGRKLKEIAKDKQAAVVWVTPLKTMHTDFLEWLNQQQGKRKDLSWEAFEAFIRPYRRLEAFAQKKMGDRFFSVDEELRRNALNLKEVFKRNKVAVADGTKVFLFGEHRYSCVANARQDLWDLYGWKLRDAKILNDLCVLEGRYVKELNREINSYREFFERKMKARRAKARKKRRSARAVKSAKRRKAKPKP